MRDEPHAVLSMNIHSGILSVSLNKDTLLCLVDFTLIYFTLLNFPILQFTSPYVTLLYFTLLYITLL